MNVLKVVSACGLAPPVVAFAMPTPSEQFSHGRVVCFVVVLTYDYFAAKQIVRSISCSAPSRSLLHCHGTRVCYNSQCCSEITTAWWPLFLYVVLLVLYFEALPPHTHTHTHPITTQSPLPLPWDHKNVASATAAVLA